jgi:hypothetical protein
LNSKQTNLVKPDDLKNTDNKKYFKVFDGRIVDYNAEDVKEKSEKLANKLKNDYFKNSEDVEIEDAIKKKKELKKQKKMEKKAKG